MKEFQLAGIEFRKQCFQEEPPEQFGQHADGQKEVWPAGDPPAVIRQAAARNDAMQVRVKL